MIVRLIRCEAFAMMHLMQSVSACVAEGVSSCVVLCFSVLTLFVLFNSLVVAFLFILLQPFMQIFCDLMLIV